MEHHTSLGMLIPQNHEGGGTTAGAEAGAAGADFGDQILPLTGAFRQLGIVLGVDLIIAAGKVKFHIAGLEGDGLLGHIGDPVTADRNTVLVLDKTGVFQAVLLHTEVFSVFI